MTSQPQNYKFVCLRPQILQFFCRSAADETSNPFFARATFHWLWHYPQVIVICLHLIKHVPLGFNTLLAPPVCILRAKLWKVVIKCKVVMFLTFVPFFQKFTFLRLWHFISSYSDAVNPIFTVVVWICKFQGFEDFFSSQQPLLL